MKAAPTCRLNDQTRYEAAMHDSLAPATPTIDQQHREIVACCDELLDVIARESSVAEVGRIRLRLAGLLQANLALEEAEVMGPIRRLPTGQRPPDFAVLTDDATNLRATYSEHVRMWNLTTIANDPKAYGRDASNLIRQMKSHLRRKQLLFPDWKRALS
jgi:3',5'-cyclic AMP phosphodiesterase CpdA